MMWWYRDGMSGWGYVLLTVSTVVFWGVLIAGGGVAFRYLNRMPVNPGNGETRPTPEQLLGRTVIFLANLSDFERGLCLGEVGVANLHPHVE